MFWCFLPKREVAAVSWSGSRLLCYPTPLRNPHPAGTAKGCCGTTRDVLVVALVGHNSGIMEKVPKPSVI